MSAEIARSRVAAYTRGKGLCANCRQEYSVVGNPVLSPLPCPDCGAFNHVPRKMGEYWLFEPVGGGAMGAVYKAHRDDGSPDLYAVKIPPAEFRNDKQYVEDLRREFRIIMEMGNHPCIVSAIDSGAVGNECFLVMEYIHGERLDHRILQLGRLPEKEVITLALRLIAAEAHVYNQGYLFRDLKPENIIVTEDGARLFDYGITKEVAAALEDPGDIIRGSPMYMPPERLTGEGERVCSEIYSLGMVLFHCLTGQPYFSGTGTEEIAAQHISVKDDEELSKRLGDVNQNWAKVIGKMIKRDMRKRPQTFAEAEADLLRMLKELHQPPTFDRPVS
jgi:serine/threonine-protein kinase